MAIVEMRKIMWETLTAIGKTHISSEEMLMNEYLAMEIKERKCDGKGVREIQWLLRGNVWEMPLNEGQYQFFQNLPKILI